MLKKLFPHIALNFQEKIIYSLMFLCAAIGLVLQLINKFTLDYPVTTGPFPHAYAAVLFGICLLLAAHYLKPTMPRTFLLLFSFTMILLVIVTTSWLLIGIESTPFPLVDHYLLSIDEFMHFYTLPVMTWTFQHNLIHEVLVFCYGFVLIEIFIMPLILAILNKVQQVYEFFMLLLSSFIITGFLYLLFPANGPYTDLHSAIFPATSSWVVKQFYDIHHFINPGGDFLGIISFPSLHIFWILIVMYVVKDIKWLFFSLAILNALAFLSTLLLGWHYLIDVIASVILFFTVLVPLVRRSQKSEFRRQNI